MKIIVIIVTYNGMRWIERCLGSVLHSSLAAVPFVVDNGSSDGTPEFIAERYPGVRVVRPAGGNLGFGRANNIGMRYALEEGADYIYLLNQDAWIDENTLEKLIDVQRRHPEYGILSPMQYNGDRTAPDESMARFSLHAEGCPGYLEDAAAGCLRELYDIRFVMAAHWLISRSCLETVGLFSTIFRHYGEDNNYVNRVVYHGFRVGLVPGVGSVHDRGDRSIGNRYESGFYYAARFLPHVHDINRAFLPRYAVYLWKLIVYECACAVHDRSFAPLRYIWQGITVVPGLYRMREYNKRPYVSPPRC